ncbi:chitin deacetylase 7-like [Stegodyphus dumicola]|uniref:chitin deacetylase 7-like n=1 Tax=Stegodyphus dumicola TaxID=202533 RepID=UPI0015B306D5|nr:chitin deacetylase 7-like [Stegodyphus dumicola]
MLLTAFCLLFAACGTSVVKSSIDYDDSYSDEDSQENKQDFAHCDSSSNCLRPNCSCFGAVPLDGDSKRLPQFIMLTFDDAVNTLNVKTYRLIGDGRNNSNGCPITSTFFVSHEYNDYEFVNEMYNRGHDIAVHSITHESNTELWKTASLERWTDEMAGMRDILSRYALIPSTEIQGHRAPFLQTAGDVTFQMLQGNAFAYDSSMPTRVFMEPPTWPYTLDFGYPQDCQIQPCPKKAFPGLWVFPMVQWRRISKQGKSVVTFHCSMLDACTPYPETEEDTFTYLMDNFHRHYYTSKAPFPVFLHEAWLRNENRLKGYLAFLDNVLKMNDVFVVSMREVLEYMRKPVDLEAYKSTKRCFAETRGQAGKCNPVVCNYRKRNILMKSCVSCPKRYPWLKNTKGEIIKT